jgi:predicted dehydrogenase
MELVGSWERSKNLIQQDYPTVKSYPSLESVLDDDTIDLIVVNTPTATHFEYAEKALQANKHIVVEKAFTTTVDEAIQLKNLAFEKDRVLSVFQNRRWDSDFRTVQQIIEKGVLGDIVQVTIAFDRYSPGPSPKVHKEIPSPGSGIVKDLGPHLIDQVIVLFGMPDSVFADIAITRPFSKVDDYFEILLFYPTFRVRLLSSYYVKEPVPSYVVHGTTGSFLKSRGDLQEQRLLKGEKPIGDWSREPDSEKGLLHTEIDGRSSKELVETLPGDYRLYYDQLYRSLVSEKEVPVSADDGIRVMQIIEAAIMSNHDKRIVTL